MSQSKKLKGVALGLIVGAPAVAFASPGPGLAGQKADNFMLADQTGMGHELYYYDESVAIVIVTSAQHDAVSAKATTALNKVREAYKGKHVTFMMLDSALKSDHSKFEGRLGSAELPVLADDLQLVGRALGVNEDG